MKPLLKVIHFYGIHTNSLGHYLSGLGLLSAVAQKWPSVRAAWQLRTEWRSGHLVLLDEDLRIDHVRQFLLRDWKPTPYERWWSDSQKKDTKAQSSLNLWKARNNCRVSEVRILDAHIVGVSRNRFNRILGTGGNVGKRDLAKLHADAWALIKKNPEKAPSWLDTTLDDEANSDLPDLPNAGTWFVFANKTFNSGQGWFREGRISPWSALLALEGAFFLVGGVNKRLGARSHPYAVFPFVSEPSQPVVNGEVGASKAEFWAPLWGNPATRPELQALIQRGLAQLGGRPALAPHEFAVAARAAGVDAGVTAFARFELRQTTSSQVYEATPRQQIRVGPQRIKSGPFSQDPTDADFLMQLIDYDGSRWIDSLPPDNERRFYGLRGPVEAAIIDVSAEPSNPERWQSLLRLVAQTQFHIDRNRSLRDRCIPLPALHPAWFKRAWPDSVPVTIRIAQAIASIGAGTEYPLQSNVFGVDQEKGGRLIFPQARPQKTVWHTGNPTLLFAEIIQRRLIDKAVETVPLSATRPCSQEDVNQFLAGVLDVEEIASWIPPLALIDWSATPLKSSQFDHCSSVLDGTALLNALFRPLFHPKPTWISREEQLFPRERQPHAGLVRRVFHLLRFGQIDEAIQVARQAYLASGRSIIVPPSEPRPVDDRFVAALLIPIWSHDVAVGVRRWLEPCNT